MARWLGLGLVLAGWTAAPAGAQQAPQLTAITLTTGAAATPAAPVSYSFSLTAGSNPVTGIILLANDPSGYQEFLNGDLSAGTITFTPEPYWLNGTYTVTDVIISDSVGITDYTANGTVTYPNGETGAATDPVTPALNFMVSGASATVVGPALNSVSLVSNTVAQNGFLVINFNTTPGTTGVVSSLGFDFEGPAGTTAGGGDGTSGGPGAQTIQFPMSGFQVGTYTIDGFTVGDGFGAEFFTSNFGNFGHGETPGSAPVIDFSTLTFTVVAAPTPTPTPVPTPTPAPEPTPTPTPTPSGIQIVTQPASESVTAGSTATLTVSASGAGLAYQWFFNGLAIAGATNASYSIAAAQLTDSGSYTVTVLNSQGYVLSQGAVLAVASAAGGPNVSMQPISATVPNNSRVAFDAGTSESGATYQWYLNGLPAGSDIAVPAVAHGEQPREITGGTSSTLLITGAVAADGGQYSCLITTAAGSVLTATATLSIAPAGESSRLTNLSCRAPVGTGAGILIAGFTTGGAGVSGAQPLLIRASGPALAQFSLTGLLADPELGLFDSSQSEIASDSGWAGNSSIAAAATALGAFAWTSTSSHDSALLQSLAPGSYTAQVAGASDDSGLGLVEIYDDSASSAVSPAAPRLTNLSARINCGTGSNILIVGFVIHGETSKTVLIRGSGPALAQFALSGLLPDPKLQVYDSAQNLIGSNAGWNASPQVATVAAAVGAFSWGRTATPDSALVLTLPPGGYTVQVSGASNDTGIALVEVYEVE